MTNADREALRRRAYDAMMREIGYATRDGQDLLERFAEREVDRAVRRDRKKVLGFCHDCGGGVVASPVLCGDCLETRNAEGMDADDMRTIEKWRKT